MDKEQNANENEPDDFEGLPTPEELEKNKIGTLGDFEAELSRNDGKLPEGVKDPETFKKDLYQRIDEEDRGQQNSTN